MNEKVKGKCDRCSCSTNNISTMSMFNNDIICIPCKEVEKNHPDYQRASDVELSECKKGNYNFEGIGLPEDLKQKV